MKKIAINFFEFILSKNSINVPYLLVHLTDNEMEVRKLRKDNSKTFFSHSRDKVFFWGENKFPVRNQSLIEGNKDINESRLFTKIIKESLLKQFSENKSKFRVKKDLYTYKITFLDNDISNGKYNGLVFFKNFRIHFTHLDYDENNHLGFTVSTSTSVRSHWKEEDFTKNGIEIDSLKFDEETGKVFTFQNAKHLLSAHFNYASRLKDDLDKINSIQNEYQDINDFVKKYFEDNIDNFILPDGLKINEFKKTSFLLSNIKGSFQTDILSKPERFFRNGNKPDNSTISHIERKNIKDNKPFTYDDFENRDIKIKIIVPKHCVEKTQNFFEYVKKQLKYTFGIKSIIADGKGITDFSLASYQEALNKVGDVDLVVVVIDEKHKELAPNNSPYYFCKSKFLERGINTQEVLIQRIEEFLVDKKANSYNFTDDNISLNMYAKLGGMGWTIKPAEPKNELIIGIGVIIRFDFCFSWRRKIYFR
jgi:hypothetical protein